MVKTGRQNAVRHVQRATVNSVNGLRGAARSETAVRIEMALIILALPLGIALAPSAAWYVGMIAVLLATLAVELLNTAVEKLADHVTPERHAAIGFVKDLGSAAVLCMIAASGLTWSVAAALRVGWL